MTTLAELVELAPAPTHGRPTQFVLGAGEWRWVVELADPAAGSGVIWHDVTEWCAGVEIDRGADEFAGRYRACVATLVLTANDDRFAPVNPDTSPTFGTHIVLGSGLLMRAGYFRVVGSEVLEWRPRFTNRVEDWRDASSAQGKLRRHEITTRDLMTDLIGVRVSSSIEAGWYDRSQHVFFAAGWEFGQEIYGARSTGDPPTVVLVLPARAEVPSAEVELDVTFDPAGIEWRTLRSGKLIAHPVPGDTFHADLLALPGAVGIEWVEPPPVEFSVTAEDDGRAAYKSDPEGVDSFGIDDSEDGVKNNVIVSDPLGPDYDIENAISIQRHGRRELKLSWLAANDEVADAVLVRRANASLQARPLVATHQDAGFFDQVLQLDHAHPIGVAYQTSPDRLLYEATGRVRKIKEQIRPFGAFTHHRCVIESDLDSVTPSDPILGVENLALSQVTDQFAEFTWDNPAGNPVTPTATQVRMLPDSSLWVDQEYPLTGLGWTFLDPERPYTFEVRLIRRVDGRIRNVSPVARLEFSTLPGITIDGDGTDTTADLPEPDEDCEVEWELQKTDDGETWTLVTSGTAPDGGEITLPASLFEDGFLYRVRSREVCSGVPGDWQYSAPFDPPDTWSDPCTAPPSLLVPPFDDAILYVPRICAPDVITEAISQLPAGTGPAYGGLLARFAAGEDIALASGAVGGTVAYGPAPQLTGLIGSKTIAIRLEPSAAEFRTLLVAAAIEIGMQPSAGGWQPRLIVTMPTGAQAIALGSEIALDTPVELQASYNTETGVCALVVDGTTDVTVVAAAGGTANAIPGWAVGLPPNSWCTDVAVWDRLLEAPQVGKTPDEIAGLFAWWDASDEATITDAGGAVSAWADKSGNSHDLVSAGSPPSTGATLVNGLNVLDFATDYLVSDEAASVWKFLHGAGGGIFNVIAVASFGVSGNPNTVWGLMGTNVGSSAQIGLSMFWDDRASQGRNENVIAFVTHGVGGKITWNVGAATSAPPLQHNLITLREVDTDNATPGDRGTIHVNATSSGNALDEPTSQADPQTTLHVGALGAAGVPMVGELAEIVIYDQSISDADMADLHAHLVQKWNLPT